MKSFVLHGEKPEEIVDPNIRTDFNKLAYLIKLDHGLGENFSVIKEIAEQGEITTDIVTHFSALEMTDPSNFKSLLFYFGLLSIKGVDMVGRPILHVPNLVVREQLFNFLIQGYIKHDIFKIDMNRMSALFENMAFRETGNLCSILSPMLFVSKVVSVNILKVKRTLKASCLPI